jgi:hypothetical protein
MAAAQPIPAPVNTVTLTERQVLDGGLVWLRYRIDNG